MMNIVKDLECSGENWLATGFYQAGGVIWGVLSIVEASFIMSKLTNQLPDSLQV